LPNYGTLPTIYCGKLFYGRKNQPNTQNTPDTGAGDMKVPHTCPECMKRKKENVKLYYTIVGGHCPVCGWFKGW